MIKLLKLETIQVKLRQLLSVVRVPQQSQDALGWASQPTLNRGSKKTVVVCVKSEE
jgi:hypothetical protein